MTSRQSTSAVGLCLALLALLFAARASAAQDAPSPQHRDEAALASQANGVLASSQTTPPALEPGHGQEPPATARPVPQFGARLIREVKPEYTPEARAAGLQGSVVLYLEISASGEVETAHVIQTLGLGLDQKAIEAVKQRRYQPAILDGKPVEVEQSGEVRFLLDPPTPWRIHRSALNVDVAEGKKVNQLSKPLLKEYVSPATEACPADGGFVIVSLKIDEDGMPGQIALKQPAVAMADAALKAIQSWRFQPGFLNGKPRAASANIEMECRAATEVAAGPAPSRSTAPPVLHAPSIVNRVAPAYSEEARRAKMQGTVTILVVVDPSGHAVSMRVLRKLGAGLDEKAMEAINQWRFRPGTRDGKAVSTEARVDVSFRLL
ncbi:MAG: TonB family protein [Bryobacteraceae bacterium]